MGFLITVSEKLTPTILHAPAGTLFGVVYQDEPVAHIKNVAARAGQFVHAPPIGTWSRSLTKPDGKNKLFLHVKDQTIAGYVVEHGRLLEAQLRIVSKKDLWTRNRGLGVEFLDGKTVAIIGLGVGGRIARLLVQAGVRRFLLIDPDTAEPFLNQELPVKDVGRYKTKAYRDQLLAKNPWVSVKTVEKDVTTLSEVETQELLEHVDLLILATDSIAAQAHGNKIGLALGIRTLFVGYYPQAWGGELVWVIPGETACYNCIFGSRLGNADVPFHVSALGSDIALAADKAVAYALALLGDPNRAQLLIPNKNVVFFACGCNPRWVFQEPLETVVGVVDRGCTVCSGVAKDGKLEKINN